MMNHAQLIVKLDKAWDAFHAAYAGLSDEQLLKPGVTGDWSVRDILAHVSWWEQESLTHLPQILQGIRPPRYADLYGGIDAFNAQMTELRRGLSLSEVRQELEETHRQLVVYVQSVPAEAIASETPFRHRLRLDTYSHYPIHTQAIREWREKQHY
jgi:hypothetical protein